MPGDTIEMGEDLGAGRILLGWDVAGLFQQRHVDVGLDVAAQPGVTVPVPGTAEIPSLLNYPDIVHACFAQANGAQDTTPPAS